MKEKVLVLDDDLEMRRVLCDFIVESGFHCIAVGTAPEALEKLKEEKFALLISDLRIGKESGMDVLREVKKIVPALPVIIITAFGSIENAIEAIKEGAYHYITKPFKMAEISIVLNKAIESAQLRQENADLRQVIASTYQFENILGRSKAMQSIFDLVQRLETNTSNVLVTGASGTGKELVAKAIHFNSPLKRGPFVAINCASIPEGLLESELFGHAKGAFTGAVASRVGLIEEADGGSLFLDEIGDMPMVLQSKLLRVLQDQIVRPLGGRDEKRINVRFISATHKNLEESIAAKQFREDLYYRLNVIPLRLPPLAERLDDIPMLARHFLTKHSARTGKVIKDIAPGALDLLMHYSWPGNVRELENIIERAMAFARSDVLTVDDIPVTIKEAAKLPSRTDGHHTGTLEDMEIGQIKRALKETNGNKDRAAKLLGINRRTLYRKGERYGIDLGDKDSGGGDGESS